MPGGWRPLEPPPRDRASQGGDPYWVRRYSDPARPGLPKRILLTSRSRGAHLLIPLGALDLERALSAPPRASADPAAAAAGGEPPRLRCELKRVYWNRSFAGIFLQLRFPERPRVASGPKKGDPLGFDLVVVRGNELRTTDFLLQPDAELYRSLLTAGRRPTGELWRNPATGGEAVVLLCEDAPSTGLALFSPVSLFDELGLCWGGELATIVDDRWEETMAQPYALEPPGPELRARVLANGELELAARLEHSDERRVLADALARFAGP